LFQVTPKALGKKIRCRGCRGIFHIPRDTSSVPLGALEAPLDVDELLPPQAIPCVIGGQDARSCPACGRTFRMKDSFVGKTIRCRGCKTSFRVTATEPPVPKPARPQAAEAAPAGSAPPPVSQPPLKPPPKPSAAQPRPQPTIFEDVGDLLDELLPGEKVSTAVRPPRVPPLSPPPSSPIAGVIAVVFGGVCAIPITLILLRMISKKRFDDIAMLLPDFLVGWLR